MTDFSKTSSRNTVETCTINFLTLVSYSTSIVLGVYGDSLARSNVSRWLKKFSGRNG